MARWFPRLGGRLGINKPLLAGCVGALAFAALSLWAVGEFAFGYRQFGITIPYALRAGLLTGDLVRAFVFVVAAWRLAIGKGLVWGSVALLLGLSPVVNFFFVRITANNVGWMVLRVAIGAALIAGIRATWRVRNCQPAPDYREVFE